MPAYQQMCVMLCGPIQRQPVQLSLWQLAIVAVLCCEEEPAAEVQGDMGRCDSLTCPFPLSAHCQSNVAISP